MKTECTATNAQEEKRKMKSLREADEAHEHNDFVNTADKNTFYGTLDNYKFVCQAEIE